MTGPEQVKKAPQRIGVRTFRGNLDAVLRAAQKGASFLVTARGEVLAEIRPPEHAIRTVRRPGALRGRIHMAHDFDTLPQEVLAALEDAKR
jgi:antitoxin (DNA-binding transcriptional repressor) of toxin-antitoxin stability system